MIKASKNDSKIKPVKLLLYSFIPLLLRLPALYSTDDGSRQGHFFHVGGKKIKNKNSWPADVGEKKK